MSNTGRITIARRLLSFVWFTPEECSVQLLNMTAWPAGTGIGTMVSSCSTQGLFRFV